MLFFFCLYLYERNLKGILNMNLERLLAENMIRFGVKNLNEQLRKTLLNEAYTPGQTVPVFKGRTAVDVGNVNGPALLKKVQQYEKGIVQGGAILATAVGIVNSIKKDKKLNKATGNQATNDILYTNITANTAWFENEWAPLIDTAAAFTYAKTEVSVYPSLPPNLGAVATMGKLAARTSTEYTVQETEQQKATGYPYLISYFNSFNMANVIEGDFTQYRLSDMVDSNNHVNLLTVSPLLNTVIVYTATSKTPGTADKNITTNKEGATQPIPKDYDISFEQGKSAVPAADPEVARAVADAIAMFPDGNITNLSVISSASPDYVTIKNVPGWEKSYPNGIDGTTDPGPGTDDASKNIKLAYDRGVNFVAAINAGLVAQGKPEMVNTTINWKISDKDGTKVPGRYAKVLWSTAGTPGTDVTKMANTGQAGTTAKGQETYTIFQHVFTCVA